MSFLTRFFPDSLKPFAGRITITALGFIIAILFLTLGFWKTLLVVILTALGYLLGKWEDGALDPASLPIPARWR